MPFPQPAEYDDAIQNPTLAFADRELKGGVNDGPIRCGSPGPVASGNFAIVYRFKCGVKHYAIKCFTREPPVDQARRFSEIHKHLQTAQLKCATEFELIHRGILVRGTFYPILKMEWLEAPTLLEFIPKQINNPGVFKQLSDSFFALSEELHANRIAHGDLQHGNLLILANRIKLIDYDGMCVPGTVGLASAEDGLPHYQHPSRRGGSLTYELDRFPSLVIWASLYALSRDPSLWRRYNQNDERLLFSKEDFAAPTRSGIIRELLSLNDERLSRVTTTLRDACLSKQSCTVPTLRELLYPKGSVVDSEWWKGEVRKVPGSERITAGVTVSSTPEWMKPEPPSAVPALFAYSISHDRIYAYIYIISFLIGVGLVYSGLLQLGLLILLGAMLGSALVIRLLASFTGASVVKDKARVSSRLADSVGALSRCDLELKNWIKENEACADCRRREVDESEKKLQDLRDRRRVAESELNSRLRDRLQKLSTERESASHLTLKVIQSLAKERELLDSEFKAKQIQIASEQARIVDEARLAISSLVNDLEKKRKEQLDLVRNEFIQTELSRTPIRADAIQWIVASNVADLWKNGVRTAADFTDIFPEPGTASPPGFILEKADGSHVRVPGIGLKRAEGLNYWRADVLRRVLHRAPKFLSQEMESKLSEDVESRRIVLLTSISHAELSATESIKNTSRLYDVSRRELSLREEQARISRRQSEETFALREETERKEAEGAKQSLLGGFEDEVKRLENVAVPLKDSVQKLRFDHDRQLAIRRSQLTALESTVRSLEQDILRYRNIGWPQFLKRVFLFAGE